jgi:hypothetical protein
VRADAALRERLSCSGAQAGGRLPFADPAFKQIFATGIRLQFYVESGALRFGFVINGKPTDDLNGREAVAGSCDGKS